MSENFIISMKKYPWPGNIRELRNLIHRLVITSQNGIIDKETDILMDDIVTAQTGPQKENIPFNGELKKAMAIYEKQYISDVIKFCSGNVTKAAQLLGIHRSLIYRKFGNKKRLTYTT